MRQSTRFHSILLAAVLALGAAGCGPAYLEANVAGPRLVWVAPGIWVVENQTYAQYYADGYYWRYVDGAWYRSPYYDDHFVRIDVAYVPRIVIGSYRPAHVRFHAPPRSHVRPIVRDHRASRRHR
jgi:hypothetical protein